MNELDDLDFKDIMKAFITKVDMDGLKFTHDVIIKNSCPYCENRLKMTVNGRCDLMLQRTKLGENSYSIGCENFKSFKKPVL